MWQKKSVILSLLFLTIVFCFPCKSSALIFQDHTIAVQSLTHYTLGQIYDLRDDIQKAILEYETASKLDPSNYFIHLKLGIDYARLKLFDKSITSLKRAHKYNTEEQQSHYLLALIYSNMGEYEKATQEYTYILKNFSNDNPQSILAYSYLGQLYYSQNQYTKAIKQFEHIYTIQSNNPDIMYLLGSLYNKVKKTNIAIEILKKALTIDPDHSGALNTIAYIYAEENKNLNQALEYVKRSLTLYPNNATYLDTLAWIYFKKGNHNKALKILIKADSLVTNDPVIKDHLGDVYFKTHQVNKALKSWTMSLHLLPEQDSLIKKINSIQNKKKYQKH